MATKFIPLKASAIFHSILNPQVTIILPAGTEVLYSQFDGDHRASLHVATYRDGDTLYQCYRLADPLTQLVSSDGTVIEESTGTDSLRQLYADAASKPPVPETPAAVDDGRELVLYRSKAGKLARYLVVERFMDVYSYGRQKGRPCRCVRLKPADWVGDAFTLINPALTPCPAGVVQTEDDIPAAPVQAEAPAHRGRPTQTAFASDLGFDGFPMTVNLQLDTMREMGRFVHANTLFDAEGEVVGAVYEGPGFDLTVYND